MFDKVLFSLLVDEALPLWASEYRRGDDFCGLNRHMVLHGESIDYGTKKNSLKTISLINYVTHLVVPWSARDARAATDDEEDAAS